MLHDHRWATRAGPFLTPNPFVIFAFFWDLHFPVYRPPVFINFLLHGEGGVAIESGSAKLRVAVPV